MSAILYGFMAGAAILQFLSSMWQRGQRGMEMGAAQAQSEEFAKTLESSRKLMLESLEQARKEERAERKERTAQTARLASEMGVQQREETRQAAYEQYRLQDVMDIFGKLGVQRGMPVPSARGRPGAGLGDMLQAFGGGDITAPAAMGGGFTSPAGIPGMGEGLEGLGGGFGGMGGGLEGQGGGLEGIDIQQLLKGMPAGVEEGFPLLSMAPQSPVVQEMIRRIMSSPPPRTEQNRAVMGLPSTRDRILAGIERQA